MPVIPAQAGIQFTKKGFGTASFPASFLLPRILMNQKEPFVYILASQRNGTLYIGVTSDLIGRVWKHKQRKTKGFTGKYSVHDLVYYEAHVSMEAAILREKQMKKWERRWKIRLIEERNPEWNDLWEEILKRY